MKNRILSSLFCGGALLFSFAVMTAPAVAAPKAAQTIPGALNCQQVWFHFKTDKNAVQYKVGEPIRFTIRADLHGQKTELPYTVRVEFQFEDGRKRDIQFVPLAQFPHERTFQLTKPGMIWVNVRLYGPDKKPATFFANNRNNRVECNGGAGVELDKVVPVPEPEDFDAFWKNAKAELAKVPLKYKMKKVREHNNCNVYAVTIDCAGPRPVTGYLSIPKNAKPHSLPAVAIYQGYGVRNQPVSVGRAGKIVFDVNAHGFLLGQDDAYYKKFAASIGTAKEPRYAFDPEENKDPKTAYFYGMAMRVMRSLEFLKSLKEWNGKKLVVEGHSQGGMQTAWAAALEPAVTEAYPNQPWCCDLGGTQEFKRLSGGWRLKYVPAVRYYDPINFCKRIDPAVKFEVRAGLGDYTCPPCGMAQMFNAFRGHGKAKFVQGIAHNGRDPKGAEIFYLVK